MAIGRICPRFKSTFQISINFCPRCRQPTKYKFRFRTPNGYKTGQFRRLADAEQMPRGHRDCLLIRGGAISLRHSLWFFDEE